MDNSPSLSTSQGSINQSPSLKRDWDEKKIELIKLNKVIYEDAVFVYEKWVEGMKRYLTRHPDTYTAENFKLTNTFKCMRGINALKILKQALHHLESIHVEDYDYKQLKVVLKEFYNQVSSDIDSFDASSIDPIACTLEL